MRGVRKKELDAAIISSVWRINSKKTDITSNRIEALKIKILYFIMFQNNRELIILANLAVEYNPKPFSMLVKFVFLNANFRIAFALQLV